MYIFVLHILILLFINYKIKCTVSWYLVTFVILMLKPLRSLQYGMFVVFSTLLALILNQGHTLRSVSSEGPLLGILYWNNYRMNTPTYMTSQCCILFMRFINSHHMKSQNYSTRESPTIFGLLYTIRLKLCTNLYETCRD